VFTDTTLRDNLVEASFEEALNRELERRAHIRARGKESTAVHGWVRRRR